MLFCAFVCTAWAGPTDLPQLSTEGNIKWYTISNTRSTSGKYLYWTENGVKDANVITTASLFYITGESLANCKIHNAATELLFTGAGAWNETGVDCAIEVTPHGEKNAGLAIKFSGTALNEKNFNDEYTTYGANDAGSIFVFSPIAKAPALPELSTEDDIKWYTIKNVRKNKYATYAAEGRMTQQAEVQDASLFYFTGSVENGVATVKIHNGQAGGLLFGDGNAWTEEGIDWYIGAVTSTGVAISKTSNFSGNNSWNDFQGGGAEVDYWGATDAGSIWVIEEFGIDVKETIAKLLKAKESPIIGEPKYDEAAYNSLVSAYEQLKAEATVANYGACTAIMAGLQPYMPEVGKFYVIECPIFYDKQGVHKALYSNGEELRWGTFDKANNSFYWTPVATEFGLAWKNVSDGKFILGKSDGGQSWTMAETSEGAEFGLTIVASGASQSNYQYAISVTGRHLHANNHSEGAGNESNVVSWETNRANSASAWTLTEYADPTANKPITVKYSFTYGGVEKFSQDVVTLVGEEYPAVNVTFPFGVSAQKPEGTIPADKVVDGVVTETIALTVNLPFEFATDYASITDWYYLKIKGESYLSALR